MAAYFPGELSDGLGASELHYFGLGMHEIESGEFPEFPGDILPTFGTGPFMTDQYHICVPMHVQQTVEEDEMGIRDSVKEATDKVLSLQNTVTGKGNTALGQFGAGKSDLDRGLVVSEAGTSDRGNKSDGGKGGAGISAEKLAEKEIETEAHNVSETGLSGEGFVSALKDRMKRSFQPKTIETKAKKSKKKHFNVK